MNAADYEFQAKKRRLIDTIVDADNPLLDALNSVRENQPAGGEQSASPPAKEGSNTEDDLVLLAAVKEALVGKKLDGTWNHLMFFVSIVDCSGEQVNTDEPHEGNKILLGSDLSELQYLVLMAVGYEMDEIKVGNLPVSLVTLLFGWCHPPDSYCPEDDEDDGPDAEGCRLYSNNKETYGCLYDKFVTRKDPTENYRVIRVGL